jgi:hypothetical protein
VFDNDVRKIFCQKLIVVRFRPSRLIVLDVQMKTGQLFKELKCIFLKKNSKNYL